MSEISKKELQRLRTELNFYKKCLGGIAYHIDHLVVQSYDYGEAHINLVTNTREEIRTAFNNAKQL